MALGSVEGLNRSEPLFVLITLAFLGFPKVATSDV